MNQEYAQRMFTVRACIGLGTDSFGELIDCTQEEVEAFEKGLAEPSREILRKVALNFNISPNWIVTGEGGVYIDDEEEAIVKAEEDAYQAELAAARALDKDGIAEASKATVIEKIKAMDNEQWSLLYGMLKALFE